MSWTQPHSYAATVVCRSSSVRLSRAKPRASDNKSRSVRPWRLVDVRAVGAGVAS
jgi:hypothetical protein